MTVVDDSCGFVVTSGTYTTWQGGYQAWVELKNVSGEAASQFTVFLDVGNTAIVDGYEAVYTRAENGYMVSNPPWLVYSPIRPGGSYRFGFVVKGTYQGVVPSVVSINGTTCAQEPASVDLSVNQTLFTADGTLSLSAVVGGAVSEVVFRQDGEVIAEDVESPFALDIEITEALNGQHQYTATALDSMGNEAVDEASVLVVIGDLAVNGDFEEDDISRWSSTTGTTLSISSDESYSGGQSLFADRGAAGAYAIYNLTDLVRPGTTYPVSAQALHTGTLPDMIRMAAKIQCEDPPEGHNTYPWLKQISDIEPGVWTEFVGRLAIPDCNLVEVLLYFEGTSADVDVYIDDLKIIDPYDSIALNGDFEVTSLQGWSSWTGAALSQTDAQAYHGERSLFVNPASSEKYAIFDATYLVSAGTVYSVSVQAMHTAAAPDRLRMSAKVACEVPPEDAGPTYPWMPLAEVSDAAPGTWTLLEGEMAVPNCDITQVLVYFEGLSVEAGLYLDMFTLTPQ